MEVEGAEGKEEDGYADMEWVEEVREMERKESGRLDVELRGYMSNLIKESIRVSLGCLVFGQTGRRVDNVLSVKMIIPV
jgi:hypothetical protein